MKKDFLSIDDYSPGQVKRTLELAARMKKTRKTASDIRPLGDRTMAMIFEKPSLRTRVTFELAMVELGGHALETQPPGVRLGRRESVPDLARNLERWVDIVVARVYKNEVIQELAANTRIPAINALCNLEHPCQAMADMMTMVELAGSRFPRVKLAYVGDGNNVCHSLMLASAMMGIELAVASPEGYRPLDRYLERAQQHCSSSGGKVSVLGDPRQAVEGADFVYTDVWASMGQEDEKLERQKIFQPYQINSKLVRSAAADFYLLHCLPAHRGEEVSDELIDGPHSRVFDQAENRLHAQKAIILSLLAPKVAARILEEK
ncbi:MAG: ornithine carbamoyltransferase [Candidatus Glassbacteria bacterium]|nr:ornithine carbamoyltransferase [Candidatus Glassbacteria bacterium]